VHDPPQHPEEDLYNLYMEFIDGELAMYDENGHVIHIFERGNLSRATYKYMTKKIQDNFDSKLTPEENWANAEKAWDNLSPELQAQLFILSHSEEQNFEDIRKGLLATLADYQGFKCIKDIFANAIKCVTLDD
jgi:superfamily II RNA helicase